MVTVMSRCDTSFGDEEVLGKIYWKITLEWLRCVVLLIFVYVMFWMRIDHKRRNSHHIATWPILVLVWYNLNKHSNTKRGHIVIWWPQCCLWRVLTPSTIWLVWWWYKYSSVTGCCSSVYIIHEIQFCRCRW